MPATHGYPFKRLGVDHLIRGVSYIWWELNPQFHDLRPYVFQLQAGNTGNANATDWIPVGSLATDTFFATDDTQREGNYGKTLMTHYRVIMTTGSGFEYVSPPVHTYGQLWKRDWLLAREIVRKEQLRHKFVSVDGFLLKRMRFGARCDVCLDSLTDNITNSKCPICNGTGFKVGYHPPVPLKADMNPEAVTELMRGTEPPGPTAIVENFMRVTGFPAIAMNDVWVDGASDQRWAIGQVANMAEWRHVPLITTAKITLLPFTDVVYSIPVDGSSDPDTTLPGSGDGDTCIDHDYGGENNLIVKDGCGNPVVGATILAFTKADYDGGLRDAAHAVASSSSTAGGRWTYKICLCCGRDYVLTFHKPGVVTQAAYPLRIPCAGAQSSDSSAGSVLSSFSSSADMGPQ